MIHINILDVGKERYELNAPNNIFGRRWDDRSEEVVVNFPAYELSNGTTCTMIVTRGGNPIDNIIVQHNVPFKVTSNLSQYGSVEVGFSFQKEDYIKNSAIEVFRFLNAQKPNDFVPIPPEDKDMFFELQAKAFTGVSYDENAGEYIFYNESGSEVARVVGSSGGAIALGELEDVEFLALLNGQILEFKDGKWINSSRLNILEQRVDDAKVSYVFDTEQQLENWLSGTYIRPDGITPDDLKIGNNIYIIAMNERDFWVSSLPVNNIDDLSLLQNDKIDLTNYYTKDEVDTKLDEKLDKQNDDGGFAGGLYAESIAGGAIGESANTESGGAVGAYAESTSGGAVGWSAKTSTGFAGGRNARAVDSNYDGIDAIQLGTGTNSNPKTLQVYDYQLMDADGKIPEERLPEISGGGDDRLTFFAGTIDNEFISDMPDNVRKELLGEHEYRLSITDLNTEVFNGAYFKTLNNGAIYFYDENDSEEYELVFLQYDMIDYSLLEELDGFGAYYENYYFDSITGEITPINPIGWNDLQSGNTYYLIFSGERQVGELVLHEVNRSENFASGELTQYASEQSNQNEIEVWYPKNSYIVISNSPNPYERYQVIEGVYFQEGGGQPQLPRLSNFIGTINSNGDIVDTVSEFGTLKFSNISHISTNRSNYFLAIESGSINTGGAGGGWELEEGFEQIDLQGVEAYDFLFSEIEMMYEDIRFYAEFGGLDEEGILVGYDEIEDISLLTGYNYIYAIYNHPEDPSESIILYIDFEVGAIEGQLDSLQVWGEVPVNQGGGTPTTISWNKGDIVSYIGNPEMYQVIETFIGSGSGSGGSINVSGIDYIKDPDKTYLVIKISEDNDEFTLLTDDTESPDYTIEWGDGSSDNITDTSNPTHIYSKAGMYLITISGDFANGINVGRSSNINKSKMIEVHGGSNYPTSIGIYNVYAFRGCTNLTTGNFTNVTSVGDYAFQQCTNLTTVNFPRATSVGNSAFYECINLTTVNFPQVESVGNSAFYQCENLTTGNFPRVTSVGDYAFQQCTNLTTVNFPRATSVGNSAFYDCRSLKTLTLGNITETDTGIRFTDVVLDNLTISGNITEADIIRIKTLFTDNEGTFSESYKVRHGLQVLKTPVLDNDVVRKIDLTGYTLKERHKVTYTYSEIPGWQDQYEIIDGEFIGDGWVANLDLEVGKNYYQALNENAYNIFEIISNDPVAEEIVVAREQWIKI